jgi:Predicted DNA-binding protein with the Helix-hairpin-helix motif
MFDTEGGGSRTVANIIIPEGLDTARKLLLMRDDAQFEVGCDSDAERTALLCAGAIRGRSAPPKIPKVFMSNNCTFNCAYCCCRCGRDKQHIYTTPPKELAKMAVDNAKKNGYGVFVTSAIYKNADNTQELLAECVRVIREELDYRGFLHCKVMPGADPALIAATGRYADRLSVNIEVAQSSGYEKIAKQKNKQNILTPMGEISEQIFGARHDRRQFARSQTTQLMAGSTGEDDRTIMQLSSALYRKYRLARVYYTAFTLMHEAAGYESEELPHTATPYWRMARLYQADRLQQLYGFSPDDVTPSDAPFLDQELDPKAAWALRHLSLYPVEVNRADFDTLIRVPGIGLTYARRIIEARRSCTVTHDVLRKLRIPLKRCAFFVTCGGKYEGGEALDSLGLRYMLAMSDRMSIGGALADK